MVVGGDDPRAARVGSALRTGDPLSQVLPAAGIGWAIEQTDQPGQLDSARFAGMALVVDAPGIRLWRVDERVTPWPTSGSPLVVITVDLLAALLVLTAAGYLVWVRWRAQYRPPK
ncbi:MAG: hypothetical protein WCI74_00330 [Actinomycetes bacterium]